MAIEDLYKDQKLQIQWQGQGVVLISDAMVRKYQITTGRAYYKCALGFSSTSNVTDPEPTRGFCQAIHRTLHTIDT